jgi:hypothetical protein
MAVQTSPFGVARQHTAAAIAPPDPFAFGGVYQPMGQGSMHPSPDPPLTRIPPSGGSGGTEGAATQLPLLSSGQHERGSGYTDVPAAHGAKGAPG